MEAFRDRQHSGTGRPGRAMPSAGRSRKRTRLYYGEMKAKSRTPMTPKPQTHARKENKMEAEPMATRVAFHPFLVGMNRTQLALLSDCAIPVHFEKGQIIFPEGEMA